MFLSSQKLFAVLIPSFAVLPSVVTAKNVFCHYLVGTVTPGTGHAEQDIDDAQAMGFDAFALDLLSPTEAFTTSTVDQLFTYAATTGFKLFFSIDASSDSNLDDFIPLLTDYLGAEAYYTDTPNTFPFLSTFDAGAAAGNTVSTWTTFLEHFVNQLYFVPDFDDTADYYTDIDAWFSTWGGIVDGLFSWETGWPEQQNSPANESIASDLTVMAAATANSKSYMIPLSTLQFKHIDSSQNWYRVGEVNLPQRMTDILALGEDSPDYVEVITWNDSGESHYIGNVWPEGSDFAYASPSHAGWQPLITSFIAAYKAGGDASTMIPPSGSEGIGAMWYHPYLKTATCASDPLGPPGGVGAAQDAVNFAVVLPAGSSGMSVRVTSGGVVLQTIPVSAGLNYDSVPNIQLGAQLIELVDSSGSVILTASGTVDVAADETDGDCSFNYEVVGLS